MLRRRASLAIVALAAIAALLPAASASAATPTKVIVSLKFPAFHGTIQSPKAACRKNRTVRLYREKSGPDKLLGTGKSNKKGKWSIPIKLTSGGYYAKTPKKGTCAAAKSNVLPVD